jgi:hypothetical protein
MSTGVLETCRELKKIYTKKNVRQVGYLQELQFGVFGHMSVPLCRYQGFSLVEETFDMK